SLCESCARMREVISAKGSRFLLCRLSQTDPGYPKYPPQPVLWCQGYQRRMDPDHLQALAERDQLWAGLRQLLPEVARLARGEFDGSERERQFVQLIARIVEAELRFRANHAEEPPASC
ncbi:MAG TPA: hypothetical protein VEL76_22495, partial [Gemmataceae bacterium]|nr:hypothetical protein [Gemmataceae bacterium]